MVATYQQHCVGPLNQDAIIPRVLQCDLMRDNGIVGTKIVSTDLNGFRTIDTPVVLRERRLSVKFHSKKEGLVGRDGGRSP